jgi:hypothetical protein
MALSVKIDNPAYPKGHMFYINGLGGFENGKEREITSEQEEAYKQETGMTVRQGIKKSDTVSVSGSSSESKGGDS